MFKRGHRFEDNLFLNSVALNIWEAAVGLVEMTCNTRAGDGAGEPDEIMALRQNALELMGNVGFIPGKHYRFCPQGSEST